ncbi:MAG: cyclic nucleotide-binding domain-containing protein [Candidatus Aminicenantes bacterium]|nr:MAG: cyclic nucleotide-binding domain-containing protein [Candidatus Aminicenantes bacterium]
MNKNDLGKIYSGGESIIRQGDPGDCMYVIQEGKAEVFRENKGKEVRLAILGEEDFFGEMAIFDHELRSANVRAVDEVRVLTVDKRTFLKRIIEDPSLAFRIVEKMSRRIRELNAEVARLKT